MNKTLDTIIILGGGTSGWLSAAYLARRLGTDRPGGVAITLIEASDIPTVGVGEGTFPSLRTTLATIGVDEADFMRETSSAFKQGIRFVDWQIEDTQYDHLFNMPRKLGGGIDLSPYWLMGAAGKTHYAQAVALQSQVCDAARAPKRQTDKPYSGPLNYAYHFDAGRMATYLKRVATSLGVNHVVGKVVDVDRADSGHIASLKLEDGRVQTADLYLDCSGFRGRLIADTLGQVPTAVDDVLFADRALAVQVPTNEAEKLPSLTIATAQEAGWSWDIALPARKGQPGRRGIGHVYSSRHMDDDRATALLRDYVGTDIEPRQLSMPTGYQTRPWTGNCIAVGLAGGFLEPLEATGIAMIEAAIRLIADNFPRDGRLDLAAKRFNRIMTRRYENAVEFIKLHYILSDRDTPFWSDNRDPQELARQLGREDGTLEDARTQCFGLR